MNAQLKTVTPMPANAVADLTAQGVEQIRITHLSKQYAGTDVPAVSDLSFELYKGEILALLGPSGCGKTTTLRLIAGFEQPDQGTIHLHGEDVTALPPQQRRIGIVFQDYALFPHMTVEQNICFGMRQLTKKLRPARAAEWMDLMNLNSLGKRYPHELSGGQQQRVALARTLAAEPDLVLLDEPFSNLDASLRESTRNEMRRLFKKAGTTAILVTHDQAEALSFADKVGVMAGGTLRQLDSPQNIYQRPDNAFVAEFLGHTNLLDVEASGHTAQSALGEIELHSAAQGLVVVSLRPEHMHLEPSTEPAPNTCTVISREFRGHDYFYVVHAQGRDYKVLAPFDCNLALGEKALLTARQPAVVLNPTP
ncbi:ABC transporter ATP-binding protein [Salinispirillum sp. LH 10-3-1]|uniref:ABC transporter ATP-binding protein n=1 Tax=Salinispirillum sp. LH 10-3-1 TaxID=2952525 RepID=A0AB38YID3_9GAMM